MPQRKRPQRWCAKWKSAWSCCLLSLPWVGEWKETADVAPVHGRFARWFVGVLRRGILLKEGGHAVSSSCPPPNVERSPVRPPAVTRIAQYLNSGILPN